MQVQLIHDPADLERLAGEWQQLVSASGVDHPFLQWLWCVTWWRHYGAGSELAVVTVRRAGQLVGLAPLFVARFGTVSPVRRVFFLGAGEVCSEYLAFITRPGEEDEVTSAILDFLYDEWREWDELRLAPVIRQSPFADALRAYWQRRQALFAETPGAPCWQAELPESWADFFAAQPKKRRHELRRYAKRLCQHDSGFYEVAAESDLEPAWKELKRLHQLRWDTQGEPGCFVSPPFTAFHEDLLRALFPCSGVLLNTLRIGDRVAAAHYSFHHNNAVYSYQSGRDPMFDAVAPGQMLRMHEFRRAMARGDRVYDFLGGVDGYKRRWCNRLCPTAQFCAPAPRLARHVRFVVERTFDRLKRISRNHCPSETWQKLQRARRAIAGSCRAIGM